MNEAAQHLMGNCVGRLCWDAVGALDGRRAPICAPGCSLELEEKPGKQAVRYANCRGRAMSLTCIGVGREVVVQIDGADGTQALAHASLTPLSRREKEVMQLLSQGLPAPAIATELGIGVTTVRTHLNGARSKLGAANQAQAVAIALKAGEID
ncbi:MAG: helix-turn-helix transcriptional regulator [Proteobacteria bacterium]|nr:helix-turn-helix transcriptional regulator [Pseudomonadota bacterium]